MKMWIALVIAASAFAAGCWLGNALQERETAAARLEFAQAVADAKKRHAEEVAAAREKEQAWQAAAHHSERQANELKESNAAAVRRADDAANRLRVEGNRITGYLNSLSAASANTCVRVASAATASLGECGGRLAEVAGQSDRCEIERRTLIGAWPRQ